MMFVLAVGLSCGDGDPEFNPQSVPADKPVQDLDPMEQTNFCEEATAWAEEFFADNLPRLQCRLAGFEAGAAEGSFDAQACRAAEQQCLADPPEDEFDDDEASCNFEDLDPSCDATVGQFADCFEQAAKLTDRLVDALACDKIASGDVPDESEFQLGAACDALLENCSGSSAPAEGDGGESGTTPPG
jgi:hypothetical protein